MKQLILIAAIALGVTAGVSAANLKWNPSDPNWDTSTLNWWSTDSSSQVIYANGDNVTFDDSGTAQTTVLLSATLTPGQVVVDSGMDYTFATTNGGKLGDVSLLIKRGTGRLILATTNTTTTPTVIEAGVLEIGTPSSRATLGTGNITNNGTLSFNRTGTLNVGNNISGSGGMLVMNNGTINMRSTNTMTGPIIHEGAVLDYLTPSNFGTPSEIQISQTLNNARLRVTGGFVIPASCPITITAASGDQTTSRASLMSMAGTNIINSPIRVGGGSYGDPNSKPNVNLYSQSPSLELVVNGSVSDIEDNPYLANFFLRGNASAGMGRLYGTINLPQATLCKDEVSVWTIYSTGNKASLTWVNGGRLNLAVANALPNAQLTLNATLDMGGYNQLIGPLYSGVGTFTGVLTNSSTADVVLTIGDGGIYYGTITDGGTAGKIGIKLLNPGAPNAQQFHNVCNYGGPTTLQVATAIALIGSGSIPNTTPIEMSNGSSISALGKPDQTFTLGAAQTLKVDGTANIAGNFINQGTLRLKVNKADGVITSDLLAISSGYTNTFGGALYLELSGEPLGEADEIKLVNADFYAGAFNTIIVSPGAGRTWDTTGLTTDGKLRIDSTLPTIPTNITPTLLAGGTQMKLAWPAEYTGWALEAQTNTINVGLSTNWHYMADSDSTNEVYVPIDPANGTVFFRLYRP